jgi:hypothetical protein
LLLVEPSLAFRVFADGLQVEPRDALGEALLGHPAAAAWRKAAVRRSGGTPIAGLRGFLALFDDGQGHARRCRPGRRAALRRHRLGAGRARAACRGSCARLFFFAPVSLQRDAAGRLAARGAEASPTPR